MLRLQIADDGMVMNKFTKVRIFCDNAFRFLAGDGNRYCGRYMAASSSTVWSCYTQKPKNIYLTASQYLGCWTMTKGQMFRWHHYIEHHEQMFTIFRIMKFKRHHNIKQIFRWLMAQQQWRRSVLPTLLLRW